MSQTMILNPSAIPAHAPPVVEVRRGPIRWRCVTEFRSILETSSINWLDLGSAPDAEQVKRNAQRSVWRIQAGGRDFFVKLYQPNGWGSRLKLWLRGPTAAQEWQVGHYAAAHGVPAVAPVACGWLDARPRTGPSLLVTLAVPDARPLGDHWLSIRARPSAAQELIDVVARLVARAHQSGFHHRDMHAGNILVRGGDGAAPETVFVDLHNVRIGRRVPIPTVVANLAQLNQWFRRNASRTRRLMFLKRYLIYRDQFAVTNRCALNWQVDLRTLTSELNRRAIRHADRLWAKRDRRSHRDGRYFCRIRPTPSWSGLAMQYCKHARPGSKLEGQSLERRFWQELLRNPPALLTSNQATILKDSHTATVCRLELSIGDVRLPVIAKQPRPRSFIKRILHGLGESRNMRTWRMANKLANRDLPTAHPLAMVERNVLGIFQIDSILLTEAIESSGDLESYLVTRIASLPAAARRSAKNALIAALVRLLKDFHARGFSHRDCKATNLLVSPPPDGDVYRDPRLVLIDLDGISHQRRWRRDRQDLWRAVARLNVSLLTCPGVTRTDRVRFVKALLLAPGKSDRGWKIAWRDLAVRTERKRRDKAARRRWKLEHYGRE